MGKSYKEVKNMNYICNPLNVSYLYQIARNSSENKTVLYREAADPSMIYFQGSYYIFASMTLGVWKSDDMSNWNYYRLPDNLPLYDYAPDVCVAGEYVYFCASNNQHVCDHYRTKDIIHGPYEKLPGTFDFWDPHLFLDDDGRFYFYWGCSWDQPLWGIELNAENMKPIGERVPLIKGNPFVNGYERVGEDHSEVPHTDAQIQQSFEEYLRQNHMSEDMLPKGSASILKGTFSNRPYIEGPWMTKRNGMYYLQYACPGTEYNVYANAVYISDSPLGPFRQAENNPYSYHPGSYFPGAGHGSTMTDRYGNLWHTSTMRISVNHPFERRIGIWPAGFDKDGELFCNQRYGDWPWAFEGKKQDPWKNPDWFLLSYKKPIHASSSVGGNPAEYANDENVQTWWRAASGQSGEWIEIDLKEVCEVNVVQINFADDTPDFTLPDDLVEATIPRKIEEKRMYTRWILEGSVNGEDYFLVEDKSKAQTDLSHDLIIRENGLNARYLRLTVLEVPYGQRPCISGYRVFGKGNGSKPQAPDFTVIRNTPMDMEVSITSTDAVGYNILWGHRPDKLYHSYLTYQNKQKIGALVKNVTYYVRVDSFNENGITEGSKIIKI